MTPFLVVTAVIEVGAGVALMCCPSAAVALLLGSGLDGPAAVTLGRVAGAALLALGVACWLARRDGRSPVARGLIAAMLVYNAGAAGIFAYAGIRLGLRGVGLWPGVALHAGMAVWCIGCLVRGQEE